MHADLGKINKIMHEIIVSNWYVLCDYSCLVLMKNSHKHHIIITNNNVQSSESRIKTLMPDITSNHHHDHRTGEFYSAGYSKCMLCYQWSKRSQAMLDHLPCHSKTRHSLLLLFHDRKRYLLYQSNDNNHKLYPSPRKDDTSGSFLACCFLTLPFSSVDQSTLQQKKLNEVKSSKNCSSWN